MSFKKKLNNIFNLGYLYNQIWNKLGLPPMENKGVVFLLLNLGHLYNWMSRIKLGWGNFSRLLLTGNFFLYIV